MSIQEKLKSVLASIPRPERERLATAIDSGVAILETPTGDLFLYESTIGHGAPVVLIHSINAAASSYEMRPLFEGLRAARPVIAFDLPGFGLSERRDQHYDKALFQNAIIAVLEHAHRRFGRPADLIALSLGSELGAAAALARPELVRSVTMISPTGFNLPSSDSTKGNKSPDKLHISKALLSILGAPLFWMLARRASIDYYLRKSFVGSVDQGLERYGVVSAHQEGARFAPLAFLSGELFESHIRSRVYEKLECPVHVIYDTDAYTSFATLHTSVAYRDWTATRIAPTRGLPQFDRPERTLSAIEDFWAPLDRIATFIGAGTTSSRRLEHQNGR